MCGKGHGEKFANPYPVCLCLYIESIILNEDRRMGGEVSVSVLMPYWISSLVETSL